MGKSAVSSTLAGEPKATTKSRQDNSKEDEMARNRNKWKEKSEPRRYKRNTKKSGKPTGAGVGVGKVGDANRKPESGVARGASGQELVGTGNPSGAGQRQSIYPGGFLFNPVRQDLLGSILNNYLISNNQVLNFNANEGSFTIDSNNGKKSLLVDASVPSYYLNPQDPINYATSANSDTRPRGDSILLPPLVTSHNRVASGADTELNRQSNASRSNSIFSSLIQMPRSGTNSISEGAALANNIRNNSQVLANFGGLPSAGGANPQWTRQGSRQSISEPGNYVLPVSEFDENFSNSNSYPQRQGSKAIQQVLKSKNSSLENLYNNSFWEELNNEYLSTLGGYPINNNSITDVLAGLSDGRIDISGMNDEQARNSILKYISGQQNFNNQRISDGNLRYGKAKLREDIFEKKGGNGEKLDSYPEAVEPNANDPVEVRNNRYDNFNATEDNSMKISRNYRDEPQSPKTSPYNPHLQLTSTAYPKDRQRTYNQSGEVLPPQYTSTLTNNTSSNAEEDLYMRLNRRYQTDMQPHNQVPLYSSQNNNKLPVDVQNSAGGQLQPVNQEYPVKSSTIPPTNGVELIPAQQYLKSEDGRPLLGATKIDQLMLVIQARDKGVKNQIKQAPDGSILGAPDLKSDYGVLPRPVNLVGGVEKPNKSSASETDEDTNDKSDPKRKKSKNKQCPYCFKYFTQSTHLEVHVRSHIGYKPFECSYCHKRFTQGGNLRTHYRLHTGEKPFTCDVCQRSFSRKGNLAAHKLTHENLKPFECKLDGCDKSFTQLGNLKSHQNRFHLNTLNELTHKLAELNSNDLDNLPKEEKDMLDYFKDLYKNSNKGIRGRGKRVTPYNQTGSLSQMSPSQ